MHVQFCDEELRNVGDLYALVEEAAAAASTIYETSSYD